jgi:hypothetical protein
VGALYCALVHHPVRDRSGATVTTAVTSVDVHDIARSARTFGLRGYYVVTPIQAQHEVVRRILEHWDSGAGGVRVPERREALTLCEVVKSVEEATARVTAREGTRPRLVATAARRFSGETRPVQTFTETGDALRRDPAPTLLLFGTGHGLADAALELADAILEPITGVDAYNHLSVRAAAAIIFSRLARRSSGASL